MTENVFLVNPAAANGSTGRRWPEIAHQAAGVGLEGDALLSERRGHLGELAREAALAGSRLLVVVGGDGSINEVVNGLAGIENPPAVALIPRGTGGDFVRTFGIPDDIAAAARVALTGDTQAIDLGRVSYRSWDGTDGSALFANVASAGMSGAIAQRANDTSKALGAKASYLWATFAVFAGWSAVETRLTVDDETRSGRMFDVVVANGRFFGGGMKMCPDAVPGDGLLDVVTIGDVTKRDLVLTMPKIYRGTHLPHPKAEALRGRVVTVETDEPVPVELDGEQPGTTPARFEVLPGALRLRVPAAGAPLTPGGQAPARRQAAGGAFGFCARFTAASSFSSLATRCSSSSIPRTFFPSSSTRARRSFIAPRAFCPPGSSASRASVCSPRSASLAITSRSSFGVSVGRFW